MAAAGQARRRKPLPRGERSLAGCQRRAPAGRHPLAALAAAPGLRRLWEDAAMIFSRVETVQLSRTAVALIRHESQQALPLETGGVLIGFIEGATAAVTHATGPGPRAIHHLTGFQRDGDYAQDQIDHF